MTKTKKLFLLIIAISLIVICVCIQAYPNNTNNDFNEIDLDDYSIIKDEKDDRFYLNNYQKSNEMFINKALLNDDFDNDGHSTINDYTDYLTEQSKDESFIPYILNYIQKNYEYRSDLEQYNKIDWATYPIETIKNKCGDCEDLAILIISILYRSGYDCGIVLFQDHALAVVNTECSTVEQIPGYTPFYIIKNEKTYYALEVTGTCPVGYTFDNYSKSFVLSECFIVKE